MPRVAKNAAEKNNRLTQHLQILKADIRRELLQVLLAAPTPLKVGGIRRKMKQHLSFEAKIRHHLAMLMKAGLVSQNLSSHTYKANRPAINRLALEVNAFAQELSGLISVRK